MNKRSIKFYGHGNLLIQSFEKNKRSETIDFNLLSYLFENQPCLKEYQYDENENENIKNICYKNIYWEKPKPINQNITSPTDVILSCSSQEIETIVFINVYTKEKVVLFDLLNNEKGNPSENCEWLDSIYNIIYENDLKLPDNWLSCAKQYDIIYRKPD